MWLFSNNITLNVLFVIGAVIFFLYKYFTYNRNYWNGKGIPVRNAGFFDGFYKVLTGKRTLGKLYQDAYKQYPNDKFIGGFKTRVPDLIVTDPDMIKCVLVKDFNSFMERNIEFTDEVEVLNANLFNVHGSRWKAMRQKFTPAFTSGKLKTMFPLVVEKTEEFQKFLSAEVAKNDEQEVKELLARLTTDIIGSVAFGIKMGSIEDVDSPFRKMGRTIFEMTPWKVFKILCRISFPRLSTLLKVRVMEKKVEDYFINTVKGIIEQRLSQNIKRNDFINLMLELKDKGFITFDGKNGEERIEFTDVFMTAQAFIFFAAGFETSSAVMSCTLFEMAKNPDVQKKVIAEIDKVLEKHDGKLSYDSISEMEYLECVISETMRKYPALGNLTRVCVSKYTFPESDVTVDEGVNIAIPVLALHYDPQYYPDPHKYLPERFSKENIQKRHPMIYLPFGEGPRNCIGLRFGKMQSMIGIASILSQFTIHESPKTEKKMIMDALSFVTSSKFGIWLKFQPRNKSPKTQ